MAYLRRISSQNGNTAKTRNFLRVLAVFLQIAGLRHKTANVLSRTQFAESFLRARACLRMRARVFKLVQTVEINDIGW
jgi:hypothetical protein